MGQLALFIDRDGVVNVEKEYVHRIEDFEFIDGVFDVCREAQRLGYRLIIITNQAGIARGYYQESDYQRLTDWMLEQFSKEGIRIDGTYFCPHHPVHGQGKYRIECECRKPAPGMILRAADEHNLCIGRSVLVGDKSSDIEAGRAAGVGKCYLVSTGHALTTRDIRQADSVLDDIRDIVSLLEDDADPR